MIFLFKKLFNYLKNLKVCKNKERIELLISNPLSWYRFSKVAEFCNTLNCLIYVDKLPSCLRKSNF